MILVLQNEDVQFQGPMDAEGKDAFDVGGAGRAGDESQVVGGRGHQADQVRFQGFGIRPEAG